MQITKEVMDRARGEDGGPRLQVQVSDRFLIFVNVESARLGLSNRDFVIQAILKMAKGEF